MTFRHWTDKQFSDYAEKIRKTNPNSLVIEINSNWVKYDNILSEIEMYLKKDNDGRLSQPIQMEDIERVIFLVRHKSVAHISLDR